VAAGNGVLMAGLWRRSWLAPLYDRQTRALAIRAIRASRRGTGVRAWVTSPSAEYRDLDEGGWTFHEREFARSFYYPFNADRRQAALRGARPAWSARVRLVSPQYVIARTGVRARQFQFRVWPAEKARTSTPADQRWVNNPAYRSSGDPDTQRYGT